MGMDVCTAWVMYLRSLWDATDASLWQRDIDYAGGQICLNKKTKSAHLVPGLLLKENR